QHGTSTACASRRLTATTSRKMIDLSSNVVKRYSSSRSGDLVMARQHRLSTQGGLITVLATVGAGLTWPTVLSSVEAVQSDDFPHVIEALATLLLAAVSGWILLIV